MKARVLVLVAALCGPTGALAQDAPGSADHPLFNRMPGYRIAHYKALDFDSVDHFRDEKGKKKTVEGRSFSFNYAIRKGEKAASGPQVLRNYLNAVRKAGGTVVLEEGCCNVHLKLTRGGTDIWIRVMSYSDARSYKLWIVEEAAMEQFVVVDATAMLDQIKANGRVALYGIHFDTGKSVVKPESEPTLKEIARLLRENAGLKLHVVGHTDSVGDLEGNMGLSRSRAKAVRDALVTRHGAEARRLNAAGVGPLSPVATNDTDEGRARNRRVELLKQ